MRRGPGDAGNLPGSRTSRVRPTGGARRQASGRRPPPSPQGRFSRAALTSPAGLRRRLLRALSPQQAPDLLTVAAIAAVATARALRRSQPPEGLLCGRSSSPSRRSGPPVPPGPAPRGLRPHHRPLPAAPRGNPPRARTPARAAAGDRKQARCGGAHADRTGRRNGHLLTGVGRTVRVRGGRLRPL